MAAQEQSDAQLTLELERELRDLELLCSLLREAVKYTQVVLGETLEACGEMPIGQ